jgi:nicotinamidase-related amidase
MIRAAWFLLAAPALCADFSIELRSRVQPFKGAAEWRAIALAETLSTEKTAILVCDMWDRHWCGGATERVNGLVKVMNPVLDAARARGIQIVHSPSNTMAFYQDAPQRKRMLELVKIDPPPPLGLTDPPLPIDDKSGGCDTGEKFYKAWTRQHPGLTIGPDDVVSDNGDEVYSLLRQRGIGALLVMGVHTNMCILNRSFTIKAMTNRGIRTILVRDLTDAMYDPRDRPQVSHAEGTALVIEHIERYWCPSTTSGELLQALAGK